MSVDPYKLSSVISNINIKNLGLDGMPGGSIKLVCLKHVVVWEIE